MKNVLRTVIILCILVGSSKLNAQFPGCPSVTTASNVTIPCGQTCATLTASAFSAATTTSYTGGPITFNPLTYVTTHPILVNVDDRWSSPIPLGFNFCYFGNTYNTIVVGSNGVVSFNAVSGTNSWQIPGPIPFAAPADLTNCIMGPWQDLDPTNQGRLYYDIIGTAPCRTFVVSWYQMPMFGDPNSVATGDCNTAYSQIQQIVLYETTNAIDIYIQNKDYCTGWNNGWAIEGIQNAAGTVAYSVPGRNATQWTASNDGYRFTPAGAPNFAISWLQGSTVIGNGPSVQVCPTTSTNYTAQATYTNCDNSTTTVSSNVFVGLASLNVTVDSVHQVSCNNGSDGAVYASYNATSAVVSYGWTPGGANQTHLDGVPPGTYTFTVTTSDGCTQSQTVTLTNPPLLTVTVPDSSVNGCSLTPTASLTATPSGGTPGYTYLWSAGAQTTQTISGLGAGTYTVQVTDAHGCTASDPGTVVIVGSTITFNAPTLVNPTCNGGNNGSITTSLTGGQAPITYTWTPTGSGTSSSGLTAGTYNILATDAGGCSATASYTLTEPSAVVLNAPTITNVTCNGAHNGSITANATGGTGNITYAWTPTATGATINGLAGGNYTVTATDANGCSTSAAYTVTEPSAVVLGAPVITNVSCNGGNNGSITASATGGTGTITYTWTPTGSGPTITGLTAGNYTVNATDASGCSASATYNVTQPSPLVFTGAVVTNASCAKNSGSILSPATGGTAPITYSWNIPSNTDDSIIGIGPGVYSITATDANGCNVTASYTISQVSNLAFGTPVITPAGCSGAATGSITVVTTGNLGPVTYVWNPAGNNTATHINLASGIYAITATDSAGCSANISYVVGQTAPVVIDSAHIEPVACSGTGSAQIYVSGGTPAYTYSWTGAQSGNTNPLNNIPAGSYTVVVTDANGCSASAYYIVGHSSCGGCPEVNTNNNVAIPCSQTCTTLNATAFSAAQTTTYTGAPVAYNPPFAYNSGNPILVAIDDRWSSVINLGFNFCFFGNAYNQIIVGSNGVVSFNTFNAGQTNSWSIPGPIPSTLPADLTNCIMSPWQDMDPTHKGKIRYQISGVAPCRKFEVSWDSVPMYGDANSVSPGSCAGQLYFQSQQIVLYETTNAIDIYIKNKGFCVGWNNGWATEGIQNAAGTTAFVVPGRNASTWNATNDGYRFTPAGAPNYVIAWYQNGNQVGTGNNLQVCPTVPTTYTVQATYTNCDNSTVVVGDSVFVTPGGTLTAQVDSVHQITCSNPNGGAVYASYNAGTATVSSFGWTPGGANQTALINIPAGTYIFTVTTTSGCSKSDTVVLTNPTAVHVVVPDDTIGSCGPGNNGTLTATATGGTAPYNYVWSNALGGPSISNLTPGTYFVTATDAGGCRATDTAQVVLINNPAVTFNAPVIVNANCTGPNTGSITVSTSGGTQPITYTWTGGISNTNTATGLAAGNYGVTATDANGCSAVNSYIVNPAVPVVIDSVHTLDPLCNGGNNGSITVFVSGGTGTLTYTWTGSASTTSTASGLSAGPYSVIVSDTTGCSASAGFQLGQPAPIVIDSAVLTDASCTLGGTIVVYASGGSGALTYGWSNTATGDSIGPVAAGPYIVSITDANGCSISATYNVVADSSVVQFGTPVLTQPRCSGDTTGSITVTTTGGIGTITYVWNTGRPQDTTATALNLEAGAYSITVTDSVGCSASTTYILTQPDPVSIDTSVIVNVSCNGGNNGSITVAASGGTPGFTYAWDNNQTGASITNLIAGTYCVTATDAHGCFSSRCFTVTEPVPLVIVSDSITPVTCAVPGSINIDVVGGVPTYTYTWSNTNQTTDSITGLTAGTYNVVVQDQNGCTVGGSYTVGVAAGTLVIDSATIVDAACNGASNGSITVHASGGAGTFHYAWTPTAADTAYNGGLAAGSYSVVVTDSLGCSASATYNVGQPNPVVISNAVVTPAGCASTGSVKITVTGGNGTYTYAWTGTTQTGDSVGGLAAGTYSVVVTDANGCSTSATYNVTQAGGVIFGLPNITQPTCNGGSNGSIIVQVTGNNGPVTYQWNPGTSTTDTLSGLTAGTYSVIATDSVGCSVSASYTVTEPTAVVFGTPVIVQPGCGANTGSITVNATGGTGNITYAWTPTATGPTQTGLAAGTYTVTATDANGCSAGASYTLTNTAPVTIDSVVTTPATCNLGGTATVFVTGGSGIYTYLWSDQQTTNPAVNVAGGTITIGVTDANGCSASATATVGTLPGSVAFSTPTLVQPTCNGGNNGSITANVTGGTGILVFNWSPAQVPPVVTATDPNLTAGTYQVTVTDANGCSAQTAYTLTQPTALVVDSSNVVNASCGANNGSATVYVSGGTGTITYLWNNTPNASTTNTATGLTAGNTYIVTATDANGCSIASSYQIGQNNPVVINSHTITDVTCTKLGSIVVHASGGSGTLTYTWTGTAQSGDSIINLQAGGYVVTVSDPNGCSISVAYNVGTSTGVVVIGPAGVNNLLCNSDSSGSILLQPSGGTGTLHYHWNTGDSTSSIGGLGAGTYTVDIVDDAGCSVSGSFNVSQPAVLNAGLHANSHLCFNSANGVAYVSPTGGTGPYSQVWGNTSVNDTIYDLGAGTVTVTVTDNNGCKASDSVTLTQSPQLWFSSVAHPHPCNNPPYGDVDVDITGGSGHLFVTISNFGTDTLVQNPGDTGTVHFTHVPAGNYNVTLSDDAGCSTTNVFIIPSASSDSFSVVTDTATCFNAADGRIIVTSLDPQNGPFNYTLTSTNQTLSDSVSIFGGLAGGTYTINAQNASGCATTLTAVVVAPGQGFVNASPDTVNTAPGVDNQLTAVAVNFNNPVYTWTPAQGLSCTDCNNPTANVTAPTVFYVTVSDSLNKACSATDSVVVIIKGAFVMPDAFSPNGDERNDYFAPVPYSYATVKEFHIYNRWGQLIYSGLEGWDGKFKGTEQPAGTYVYYIMVTYPDPANPGQDKSENKEGSFTLLR